MHVRFEGRSGLGLSDRASLLLTHKNLGGSRLSQRKNIVRPSLKRDIVCIA